ncbi:hypothetical protein [Vreelandella massiliensis]|uniref:hypothetical protein n=1 Tax=Vreelandella massiliensis TaxID=1816686 RepID=UPI00096A83FE|nr:hypothetical protein [Halomonas massiliensis]
MAEVQQAQEQEAVLPNGGDCFIAAANLVTAGGISQNSALNGVADVTLVHGVVTGQGPVEGIQFSHAWIEGVKDGQPVVIDTSNGGCFIGPPELYYLLGNIDAEQLCRYTPQAAREKLLDHKHFGPWEGAAEQIGL